MKECTKLHVIENRFIEPFKCPICSKEIKFGDHVLEVVTDYNQPNIEWFCKDCISKFLDSTDKSLK